MRSITTRGLRAVAILAALAPAPALAAGAPRPFAATGAPLLQQLPPVNVAPPRIVGIARAGRPLRATHGSWSGRPSSYAYSWRRCNGARCRAIAGGNTATYTLGQADVGDALQVWVIAANGAGASAPSLSAPSAVVAGSHGPRPVNLTAPGISGLAQPGGRLSASPGAWSNAPLSFEYEWLRCDVRGAGCVEIPLATAPSYAVTDADLSSTLRVAVFAFNAAGESAPALSAPSALVSASSPPINVSAPAISGSPQAGHQLSATPGVWSGAPASFAFRWRRCNARGVRCKKIRAASTPTYTIAPGDVGRTLRVSVIAANSAGQSPPAVSPQTGLVTGPIGQPPVNLAPPQISGIAKLGQLLGASAGTWSGAPTSFSYQWLRCDRRGRSCGAIPGAGAASYLLGALELGATLRVSVVAFNAAGASAPAQSAASEVVTAPSAVSHYEYVFNDGSVSVYDIDNGFRLVESFALPGTNRGVRGVAVSPATHMMFVSYGGDGGANGHGSVLGYDLVGKRVVWSVNLNSGIDSGAVSSDGRLLYMPDGELSADGNWYILDTANGSVIGKIETPGAGPHNSTMSADGRILMLGARNYNFVFAYNTQTGKLQAQVGPLVGGVRPNTINGADSVSFTTATGFDGFQVESITPPGAVLYSESFASCSGPFSTCSHGVSLSPDNRQVAVIDTVHKAVQLWDVHGVGVGLAPAHIATVPVGGLEGSEEGCAYDCGRDGWLQHTLDGRYVFVGDSGDVIDTATDRVVATIGNLRNTRKFVEIDWQGSTPIATSGRQGVGRVP